MSDPSPKKTPPVFVLKSVVPPFEEYAAQLREIWENRWFTNAGPKHAELKKALSAYLGLPDCVLLGNSTFALMAALSALGVRDGEVITTPFTFVASSHCLEPYNLVPVFVDIEADRLTIDPAQIEAAITPSTKTILGVHVYGNPCYTEEIEAIARRHNLKVIYDAAHAFGVTYNGQSIMNFGDASCLSFHATKAFHTFEGGAVVSQDADVCAYIRRYRNFGIGHDGQVLHQGLNTKMSELHAAAGLVNLNHYETQCALRTQIYKRYEAELASVSILTFVPLTSQGNPNYNYCPVRIEKGRDALLDALVADGIFTRKYFYPLLTDMPAYAAHQRHFPVASKVAEEILCLPVYPDLTHDEQDKVISIIKNFTI